jgi:two-component system C4-dicarboxylate transport response regulator DctD
MRQTVADAELVNRFDVHALLLEGERGTGKEHLARFVHQQGGSPDRPFVVVDCRRLNDDAEEDRARRTLTNAFVAAQGGTLFFKGLHHLRPGAQAVLSRALEATRGELSALRRRWPRITCTAEGSLFHLVEAGRFSGELYYRINTVFVPVPPLRERVEDVEPLLQHFMRHAATREGVRCPEIREEWRPALMRHGWPGNAFEVRDVAEAIVTRGALGPLSASSNGGEPERDR